MKKKIETDFVKEYRDRHGKLRRYFRRPGFKGIPLKAEPGTAEYGAEYAAAMVKTAVAPAIGSGKTGAGSVDEIVAAYLNVAAGSSSPFKMLSAETQRTRRNILDRFRTEHGTWPLYHVVRGEKVLLLDRPHMQRIVNKKNDTPFAQRNFINTVSAMFAWAVEEGRLPDNPCVSMKRIHKATTGHPTWTAEHIARFIKQHPLGTTAYLALMLMLYTGARISDVYRFGPNNITKGVFAFDQRKVQGRDTERVEMPVAAALAEAIKRTPTVGLRTFIVTEHGKPHASAKAFGNKVHGWCTQAGIPDVSAHGLRKAGATILADRGATGHQIMAFLGHSSTAQAAPYTKRADRLRNAASAVRLLEQG